MKRHQRLITALAVLELAWGGFGVATVHADATPAGPSTTVTSSPTQHTESQASSSELTPSQSTTPSSPATDSSTTSSTTVISPNDAGTADTASQPGIVDPNNNPAGTTVFGNSTNPMTPATASTKKSGASHASPTQAKGANQPQAVTVSPNGTLSLKPTKQATQPRIKRLAAEKDATKALKAVDPDTTMTMTQSILVPLTVAVLILLILIMTLWGFLGHPATLRRHSK